MGLLYTIDITCDYPGCDHWETAGTQAIRPPSATEAVANMPPGWLRKRTIVFRDGRWRSGRHLDLCPEHSTGDVPHATFPSPK